MAVSLTVQRYYDEGRMKLAYINAVRCWGQISSIAVLI